MRLLFSLLLLVALGLSSCKKYKLKQPAYLNFKWEFFEQQSGTFHPVVTGGYFYLNQFRVTGTRVEGPPVDIVQALPAGKTSFSAGGSLGLSMDIPIGEYNQFSVELGVVNDMQPCIVLNGEYNNGASIIPFRIEWGTDEILTFLPSAAFELKKKKNYDVTIGVDVEKLFQSITINDWADANITPEPTSTIVISENFNHKLFTEIKKQIAGALILKVSE
ncbi:MAG: hypothetical protein A3D31_16595 [Candidatus Fluviicola riflensis]|nr:MAG: hypothetical protein CHH17_01535 [Candidatus Fluviicola riflensis]OGS76615.1 MAG: hypothetical protein A3D31_16595 [Candidatus Fluviicola riflensis]OGS83030.1 MAG: hypothetical protein A2724_14765 [Fluviicola sp. RIFCSPHIGHO2_01_FULL_43_53]OGS88346.1 MAG: hypothetical protein A3E30_06100 [Fluviicola sp. RIFCSPHIGHO2_12_FULL_43_24]